MDEKSNRALLLAELSDELLRGRLVETWRAIFLAKNTAGVDFVEGPFAILCADAPHDSDGSVELASLARMHGGSPQQSSRVDIALAFAAAADAMRVALALQRLARERRLRCAVLSGNEYAARLTIDGERRTFILGGQVAAAERQALATPPGSIHVCAETYRSLEESFERDLSGAMVSAEMRGDQVDSAMITLPPPAFSELSTFAGLGLV